MNKLAIRIPSKGVVVQAMAQTNDDGKEWIKVGITASRKVGGAVQRNRAKRRLRVLAKEVLAAHSVPFIGYVLIARPETINRDFSMLKKDLKYTLHQLGFYK